MAGSKRVIVPTQNFLLGLISGAILIAGLFLAIYLATAKTLFKPNVKAADCSTYTKGNAVRLGSGIVTAKNTDSFSYAPNLRTEKPKVIVICGGTQLYNRDKTAIVYNQVKAGDKIDYITGFWGDSTNTTVLASSIYDSTQTEGYSLTITDNFTGIVVPSKGYKGYIGGFDTKKWQVVGAQGISVIQNGGTLNLGVGTNVAAGAWGGVALVRSVMAGNDFDASVDVMGVSGTGANAALSMRGSDTNFFDVRWVKDATGSYVDFYGSNAGQSFDVTRLLIPEGNKVHMRLIRTGNAIKAYATIGTGAETSLGNQTVTYTGSIQPNLSSWKATQDSSMTASFDNFSVSGALQ